MIYYKICKDNDIYNECSEDRQACRYTPGAGLFRGAINTHIDNLSIRYQLYR